MQNLVVEELESLEAPGFWTGVAVGFGVVAGGTAIGVGIGIAIT